MLSLVSRGIAYHHAGMLPTLKETIERLFTSRFLKVIFTTETFALGINMPARSVIFDELIKYYGRYTRPLKTRDFYQMAGRAGRRGIDKEGFVYSRVNLKRVRIDEVRRVIYGKPEDVRSQFNTAYATILNLYEKNGDDFLKVYPLSFHYFQTREHERKEAIRLMNAKLRLLKDLKFIEGAALTGKGRFAKSVYGYELLTSEIYQEGIFEHLDEISLGILAAGIVFEPRRGERIQPLSKKAQQLKAACDKIYNTIRHKESRHGIYPFSRPAHFSLSRAMECWMSGMEFSKMLGFADADEGELIRYFRMAIQVLREMRDAQVSYLLKAKVNKTIQMINRGIVDAEKELREG